MGGEQPRVMSLLRMLCLVAARNNFNIVTKHLPGKTNGIADALSRKQFDRFSPLHHRQTEHPHQPLGLCASFNCTAPGIAPDLSCGVYPIHIQCWDEQVLCFLPPLWSAATPRQAVALSRSLAIQVYTAAVGNLHRRMGYKVPTHNNPRLRLVLRGAKRTQGLMDSFGEEGMQLRICL